MKSSTCPRYQSHEIRREERQYIFYQDPTITDAYTLM